MPGYEIERVEYWENSALDGRIYEVFPVGTATPKNSTDQPGEGDGELAPDS